MIFVSWKGQKIKKKELQEIVKKQQEQLDHMYCQIDNIYDVVRKQQKIIDEFYDDKKVREFKEKAKGLAFLVETKVELQSRVKAYGFKDLCPIFETYYVHKAYITFINKNNKIQTEIIDLPKDYFNDETSYNSCTSKVKVNDEYIEVHCRSSLNNEYLLYKIYVLRNDKVKEIDLEVYLNFIKKKEENKK